MDEELIVVTGATGNVGKQLTEKLLAGGKKVRAIARNADHLAPLAARGAETVRANIEDQDALTNALQGGTAAFLLIPPDPKTESVARHQERVITSFTGAMRDAGVSYAVCLSSVGAQLTEGTGPIKGLSRMEERVNAVPGVSTVHVRAGYFMENSFFGLGTIKQMGILGTALRGDLPMSMAATRDVAERAAQALVDRPAGKNVRYVLGPRDYTMTEVATALGKAIGKPDLKYVQFPYEDAEKAMIGMGLSPDMAKNYVEMSRGFNEGRIVPTEPRSKDNSTPTTIDEFAKIFAAVYKAS